ncbi:hypothetical protein [Xanthomonas graminis]|uniref:hypothetical protein n=1 Tax=Xanthomonas graminis TaxID=3390026 RepID=UPI0020C7701D|nr:hypothetical protein [Xanthomonas translucens]
MLPHADATLRHGEWQHTVPHGKDETERQSDAAGVCVGMRMRVAAGLARLPARFGGTAAAQGPRRDALAAVAALAADFAGEAGMDRAALHNLLRAMDGWQGSCKNSRSHSSPLSWPGCGCRLRRAGTGA